MRIYELAKKWNLETKEFVTKLQGMGYKIKNHMSTLDDELIDRIERKLFPAKFEAEAAEKARLEKIEHDKKHKKEPVIEKVDEKFFFRCFLSLSFPIFYNFAQKVLNVMFRNMK